MCNCDHVKNRVPEPAGLSGDDAPLQCGCEAAKLLAALREVWRSAVSDETKAIFTYSQLFPEIQNHLSLPLA